MDLVDLVYGVCRRLPKEELFGLRSQLTRAAVSIACNIAEGHGRGSRRDFCRFVKIARGSVCEVKTLLEIAVRNGLIKKENIRESYMLAEEIARMSTGLVRRLGAPPVK
ncbi:MAG: hypothetical protein GIKADHBN_01097 [Phycisphaerales bacterium]|nr:hypothetical protein [Phycisphaerales bacterium]